MMEVPTAECVAGRGLRGDRYFDHKEDYKGQITFFSLEVFDELCGALQVEGVPFSAVRRNVFTRNVDLNELARILKSKAFAFMEQKRAGHATG